MAAQVEKLLEELKRLKRQLDLMDQELIDPSGRPVVHKQIRNLQTQIAVMRYQASM
jgi:hypothetical protein